MIKTVKLAGYELRRFKGPLSVIGLLFLLLVPTAFGALYLWSNWDPYGKLDQIPVAVVNLDQPVQVENSTINVGDRLVTELKAEPIFAWNFVDEQRADDGLADGTYYMIITIPPDFSSDLVSGTGSNPSRAMVNLRLNDANNYLNDLLVASAQPKLQAAIDRAAIGAYLESVFANLDTIRTGVEAAAASATQLSADAKTALTSATGVSTGVTTAKQGSTQVVSGLADAKSQSSQQVTSASDAKAASASLVSGLNTLATNSSQLSSGADSVASGSQQLAGTLAPAISAVNGQLPALGQSAANVEAATSDVSDLVSQSLTPQVTQANSALAAVQKAHPNDPDVANLATALNGITTTNSQLSQASTQASAQAVAVNSAATSINSSAGALSSASSDLTSLATSAAQVSSGVTSLIDGISTASSNAGTVDGDIANISTQATGLDSSIGNLQLTAQTLDDGLTTTDTTAAKLVTTVTQIDSDATQLATGLTSSADRIPTLAPGQQADTEQVLSSPADLNVTVDNAATFYGRGMSPIAFALAIWIFAIAIFLVMRPITARALAGRASSLRIMMAGWLPVLGSAIVGTLLLFGIVWLGLGLDPVNAGGAVGVLALAAAGATAVVHLLRTWLGSLGSAIALVLLIIQLTSSGGLYPVPTTPSPFQVLHSAMPMTYLVDALRITFTGGMTSHLWRDVGVLAGITVVAVALCVLVVHRKRTFRPQDLHPARA